MHNPFLMARRSRAQNLLNDYEEIEDHDGTFIVVYDFLGFKPSARVITVEIIVSVITDAIKACRRYNPSPQGTLESRDQPHR